MTGVTLRVWVSDAMGKRAVVLDTACRGRCDREQDRYDVMVHGILASRHGVIVRFRDAEELLHGALAETVI